MGDAELIREAQELETRRASFYRRMASKVLDPSGKATLMKLSDAEKRHFNILKNQKKFLLNGEGVDLKDIGEPIFVGPEKEFDKNVESNRTDVDMLSKSVALEKLDAPFYGELIKKAKFSGVKELFRILQKEEEIHFKAILSSLEELRARAVNVSVSRDPRKMFFDIFRRK